MSPKQKNPVDTALNRPSWLISLAQHSAWHPVVVGGHTLLFLRLGLGTVVGRVEQRRRPRESGVDVTRYSVDVSLRVDLA